MSRMADQPVIESARFEVALQSLGELREFYRGSLGVPGVVAASDHLQLEVGSARVGFVGVESGRPFHHFALLVSAERFSAAAAWLSGATDLLSRSAEGDPTFTFDAWDARACYALDPAGNVLELIAHNCTGVADRPGRFSAAELRGISEVGLVVSDRPAAVRDLAAVGLPMWAGQLDQLRWPVFVGRQANTLVLSPPGRAWLPTESAAGLYTSTTVIRAGGRIRISVADGRLNIHT